MFDGGSQTSYLLISKALFYRTTKLHNFEAIDMVRKTTYENKMPECYNTFLNKYILVARKFR
ncbi:hypothetical protein GCM10009574_101740 [Streptomyces asiaticus]